MALLSGQKKSYASVVVDGYVEVGLYSGRIPLSVGRLFGPRAFLQRYLDRASVQG